MELKNKYRLLQAQLEGLETQVWLKDHTTFGIGGPADLFYRAQTVKELIKAVRLARELQIPYFILGGGSKLLVADQGFRGLVIKNQAQEIKLLSNDRIRAASGINNPILVQFCRRHSLTGLEFLIGIPGTLGGAVRHNARFRDPRDFFTPVTDLKAVRNCYLADFVVKVRLLHPDGRLSWQDRSYCQFQPHTSGFREDPEKRKEIILEVILQLRPGQPKEIDRLIKAMLAWRQGRRLGQRKLVDPITRRVNPQPRGRSAGCIFANTPNRWGHPAGRLIDLCGLKGRRIGGAKISEEHANFIINNQSATAADVVKLIDLIKREVKKKFQVELKEELEYLGFDPPLT